MNNIESRLIELGIIDTPITSIKVDDWFENVHLSFTEKNGLEQVNCNFINCYSITLNHDKSYNKGRTLSGNLDYKYYVQDVDVREDGGFYDLILRAWPLDARIICQEIRISVG